MKQSILCLIILFYSSFVIADNNDISNLFLSSGKNDGVLLIESLDGSLSYNFNSKNLTSKYSPASTFKIPHTLIALEEGVIANEATMVKWDQVKRSYAPWNKDQNLSTAFAFSCVWFYQEFTKEIASKTYVKYLKMFKYGNAEVGPNIKTFWLGGDLSISVRQQVDFLKNVYNKTFSLSTNSYSVLSKIMLNKKTATYSVYSKTGWAGKDGWFVGYVVRKGNSPIFFACHIPIDKESDLPLRKTLVFDSLKAKGLLPN